MPQGENNNMLSERTRVGLTFATILSGMVMVWSMAVYFDRREMRLSSVEETAKRFERIENRITPTLDRLELRITAIELSLKSCGSMVNTPPPIPKDGN